MVDFLYPTKVAYDPVLEELAKNVEFQFYAEGDTDLASPLPVTDPDGLPLSSIAANNLALTEPFYATVGVGLLSDGTYKIPIDSPTGMLNATEAAADAATSSAAASAPTQAMVDASIGGRWLDGALVEKFGAVGDGVTNDTTAFLAALGSGANTVRLSSGKRYLIDPDAITLPTGVTLSGEGDMHYSTVGSGPSSTIVIRATGGTIGIQMGERSTVRNLSIVAEISVTFTDANYPASASQNAMIGLGPAEFTNIENVTVAFFQQYGIQAGRVCAIDHVNVKSCDIGIYCNGNDGHLTNSIINFCMSIGVRGDGFWRFVNNRIEWNARYGLSLAGESTTVANLFDRNGWAGVLLRSGAWGQVLTGNYFSRNGCGGNGTVGRWGFAVPGHNGYVDTVAEKSCHIEMESSQRSVTITGNRFRSGSDDSGTGAAAPLFIYSFGGASGSTGAGNYFRLGNAGETGASSLGFTQGGYATPTTAIAGGTDTLAVAAANGGTRFSNEVRAPGFGTTRDQAASSTTVVITPVRTAGMILLSGRTSGAGAFSVLYFGQNAGTGTAKFVVHENKSGTMVSSSAIDSTTGVITITLENSKFTNYTILYAH